MHQDISGFIRSCEDAAKAFLEDKPLDQIDVALVEYREHNINGYNLFLNRIQESSHGQKTVPKKKVEEPAEKRETKTRGRKAKEPELNITVNEFKVFGIFLILIRCSLSIRSLEETHGAPPLQRKRPQPNVIRESHMMMMIQIKFSQIIHKNFLIILFYTF